jgi:hypothetical protein
MKNEIQAKLLFTDKSLPLILEALNVDHKDGFVFIGDLKIPYDKIIGFHKDAIIIEE